MLAGIAYIHVHVKCPKFLLRSYLKEQKMCITFNTLAPYTHSRCLLAMYSVTPTPMTPPPPPLPVLQWEGLLRSQRLSFTAQRFPAGLQGQGQYLYSLYDLLEHLCCLLELRTDRSIGPLSSQHMNIHRVLVLSEWVGIVFALVQMILAVARLQGLTVTISVRSISMVTLGNRF